MAKINGPALAVMATGALFTYAGIRGYSVLKAVQNIIQGKPGGPGGQSVALLAAPGQGGSSSGSGAGGAAGIGLSYVGKLTYVFGGPPPMGTVDCSSFASKCLAEAGVSNPGGARYDPRTHGPNTVSYLSWIGATTVGHSASDAQVNDLCVWQTHMGICIGGGRMVSARDPQEGVGIDNIAGDMPGEVLFVRRVK